MRGSAFLASLVVPALAFAGTIGLATQRDLYGTRTTGSDPEAVALVARMRSVAESSDYAGDLEASWRSGSRTKTVTVRVTVSDGDVQASSPSELFLGDAGRAFVYDLKGWSAIPISPPVETLPQPDHAWTLTSAPGATVAGRATTLVEASRTPGGSGQHLLIDTETGLLLGRDVVDEHGRVVRSVRFTTIQIGGTPPPPPAPAVAPRSSRVKALKSVPSGYRAPNAPGAGFVLVSRTKNPQGGITLLYNDGLFSMSVYEQQGDLDWSGLPAGGDVIDLAGHRTAWYTEPGEDVYVLERDDVVYTCVTDAPRDAVVTMVGGLAPADRSVPQQVVDYVLGPFGWH